MYINYGKHLGATHVATMYYIRSVFINVQPMILRRLIADSLFQNIPPIVGSWVDLKMIVPLTLISALRITFKI